MVTKGGVFGDTVQDTFTGRVRQNKMASGYSIHILTSTAKQRRLKRYEEKEPVILILKQRERTEKVCDMGTRGSKCLGGKNG